MLWRARCTGRCTVWVGKCWRWLVFPRIELAPLIHFVRIFGIGLVANKRWRRRSIHHLLMHLLHLWRLSRGICRMISAMQHVHWGAIRGIVLHGWRRWRRVTYKVSILRPDKVATYRTRIMNRRRWHRWRRRSGTVWKVPSSSVWKIWIEIEISSIGTVLKWCWWGRPDRVRRMLKRWNWR